MQKVTLEVIRMRDPRAGSGDFYAQSGTKPVFNPGNASPFHVPRTEAVPKRVGRNPFKIILTWTILIVLLGVGYRFGVPVLLDKVHSKEITAVTGDLENVAAGQESYRRLYGAYSIDFTSLSIPKTVNNISVVSAASTGYCLKGESVTGGVVLYYTPARGVTSTVCA